MHIELMQYGVLLMAFAMVAAKRFSALVTSFTIQSFLLFILTLSEAIKTGSTQLYILAVLIFAIKVIGIPVFLGRITKKIKVPDEMGLYVNTTLSIIIAALLSGISYYFIRNFLPSMEKEAGIALIIALSVTLIGLFIMIFRIKALAQVVGLLIMENGIFFVRK